LSSLLIRSLPRFTLFPYTTLFRSAFAVSTNDNYLYAQYALEYLGVYDISDPLSPPILVAEVDGFSSYTRKFLAANGFGYWPGGLDRKSTRLNSVTRKSRMPSSARK